MKKLIRLAIAAEKELEDASPGKRLPKTREFSDYFNDVLSRPGKINKDLIGAARVLCKEPISRGDVTIAVFSMAGKASVLVQHEEQLPGHLREDALALCRALKTAGSKPKRAKRSVRAKGVKIKKSKKS